MGYRIEEIEGGLVVVIHGQLLTEEAPELKKIIRDQKKDSRIVVDLSAIQVIVTPGLGLLVSLFKTCRERGLRFILTGLSPYVREILDLTRLTNVFEIAESRDDAISRS